MSAKKISLISSKKIGLAPNNLNLGSEIEMPLIALDGLVLFPGQTIPLTPLSGLTPSDVSTAESGLLRVVIGTRLSQVEIYPIGTEAIITGVVKLPNEDFGGIVRGLRRVCLKQILHDKESETYRVKSLPFLDEAAKRSSKELASVNALKSLVMNILRMNSIVPQDVATSLYNSDDPFLLTDLITPYLSASIEERLGVLAQLDIGLRIKQVLKLAAREVDLLKLSVRLQDEVRGEMQESVRKAFLREQLAAIKRELGDLDDDESELSELESAFDQMKLPKEVMSTIDRELDRLTATPPGAPEHGVILNYLTWLKDLPWPQKATKKPKTETTKVAPLSWLASAQKTLNRQHYGLDKVKERILEHIAVLEHKKTQKGQILLLAGPPGVGKTSLAKSIAQALDRPFVKVALGGVRDEAEIRGHRRTYIGAMPGRLIQAMKEAKALNPVILLDEIDKAGIGGHHDLSSALLEVLDPEQNQQFVDHYLNVPFDLSQVLFVATANVLREISPPLRDRMETIEISGYTETEKLHIAKKHLIPSVRSELGLKSSDYSLEDKAILGLIRHYTLEAGVRQLKRELSSIGRKRVKAMVERGGEPLPAVTMDALPQYLGIPKFLGEPKEASLLPGVAIGLAYTSVGGDILYIESRASATLDARGKLSMTGSLGKVMQESAHTAFTYILSRAQELGLDPTALLKQDIHVHFPDGATPKDGPSAGVALLCTLMSLFKNKTLPSEFAMTGEITLRGQVLAVGGIKEKLMAAHRYGKKSVLIPYQNLHDVEDIPWEVRKELNIYPVRTMGEVLELFDLSPETNKSKLVPIKVSGNPSKQKPHLSFYVN